MARRYTRDNRGRFSSVGATARGGRLATASGNKRATQTGRIESAVPSGTIRPGRRSAKPEAVAPAARLTPRQKAKRLGARPERMNEGPKVLASNPQGTVGASAPVRNMNRASRQIKSVAPQHSAQMVSLDVFSNRGMSAGNAGTQVRRNAFRDPGQRISRVNARAVWRDPSGSTYAKASRQQLLADRRAHSPRKRSIKQAKERLTAKNAARQRGDTASVNIPMTGRRGRSLDAEITRNIKSQKIAEKADSRSRNRRFKSDQARAKSLRAAHVGSIAKAKGLSKSQVESALRAQSPAVQIKALKSWVRDNRKTASKRK